MRMNVVKIMGDVLTAVQTPWVVTGAPVLRQAITWLMTGEAVSTQTSVRSDKSTSARRTRSASTLWAAMPVSILLPTLKVGIAECHCR